MAKVTKTRTLAAPPEAVWKVLADFPNISTWNSGIKSSYSTSDSTSGVGAQRHCDLSPFGSLEETVQTWDDSTRMTISIDSAGKIPVKSGLADFVLSAEGAGTSLDFTYTYTPKYGPIGKLLVPVLNKQFDKGFDGFFDDLDTAAAPA